MSSPGVGPTDTPEPAPSTTAASGTRAARGRHCARCGRSYEASVQFCTVDGTALLTTPVEHPLEGQVIADRYRIQRKLGEGGTGEVYLADDIALRHPCALKLLKPAMLTNPATVRRFRNEARRASRITHVNVATVYDSGQALDGTFFLAMEFVDGETLGKCLQREHTLSPRRAAAITWQVAEALMSAHELGIIHRDLKPDNVLLRVRDDGIDGVKVVDFGIAKLTQPDPGSTGPRTTNEGVVVGTPQFMSPEQMAGDQATARSDIYALGLITFRMLTGDLPFEGVGWEALVKRVSSPPRSLADVRPDIAWPPELCRIMDHVLATEPANRYATAREFARDLAYTITAWLPRQQ
jgi:serine/threonine protein kinase